MKVIVHPLKAAKPSDTQVVFVFTEKQLHIPELHKRADYAALIQQAVGDHFSGRKKTVFLYRTGQERILLVGLGDRKKPCSNRFRKAVAMAAKQIRSLKRTRFSVILPGVLSPLLEAHVAAEALGIGLYQFTRYKKPSEGSVQIEQVTLLSGANAGQIEKGIERGLAFAQATNTARDLINTPASHMPPQKLAEFAQSLKGGRISVEVLDVPALQKLGAGGILGVGNGGANPPLLIKLKYKPSGAKRKIALVGKGITFDSGGLSLKPAGSMETMKTDMSGAAAILGVFQAAKTLKLPLELHGFLACAENMPDGRALKPGDVLKTVSGKTIEVLNTDAEGRLVLSDALTLASREKPSAIVDVATLTGACIIALGTRVGGLFSNDDKLADSVLSASKASGEMFWRMPFVNAYRPDIDSKVADMKNIGGPHQGGAIIAALFLREFVDSTIPWVHLDIAGPARSDKDLEEGPAGATGFATRTLLNYLVNQK